MAEHIRKTMKHSGVFDFNPLFVFQAWLHESGRLYGGPQQDGGEKNVKVFSQFQTFRDLFVWTDFGENEVEWMNRTGKN